MRTPIAVPTNWIFIFLFLLCQGHLFADNTIQTYLEKGQKAEQAHLALEASIAYGKAVEICRTLSHQDQLPELLLKQGNMLAYAGNYTNAVPVLIECYNLVSEKTDTTNQLLSARILTQLGVVYFFMEKWDDALFYYDKAYALAELFANESGCSILWNNMGNIYQKKGAYGRALDYYHKSLALQSKIADSASICNTLYNIGSCYDELNQFPKATTYHQQAYDIAKAIADIEITTLSLLYLAMQESRSNNYAKAYLLIDEAEDLAMSRGFLQVLLEVYKTKCEIQEKERDYHGALQTLKEVKNLSDSILSEKSIQMLREFKVKYDTQEKEYRISLQKVTIKRQKILHCALVSLLILFCVIGLLYRRLYRLQKTRSKEIVEMNMERDKLFSIISHDLKNPAIAQRNLLQTLIENIDSLDKELLMQYFEDLLHSSNQQLELMLDLLNWTQIQINKIQFRPHLFDLHGVIDETLEFLEILFKEKNIDVILDLPPEILAYGDKNYVSIILRNLLTNATKFSHTDTKITIQVRNAASDMWKISIIDQGVGISPERIPDLFSLSLLQTRGVNGEGGSGLGLIVCKELVEKNGGKIEVESRENEGSVFSFTLSKQDVNPQDK